MAKVDRLANEQSAAFKRAADRVKSARFIGYGPRGETNEAPESAVPFVRGAQNDAQLIGRLAGQNDSR